jgi:hypothetical protein
MKNRRLALWLLLLTIVVCTVGLSIHSGHNPSAGAPSGSAIDSNSGLPNSGYSSAQAPPRASLGNPVSQSLTKTDVENMAKIRAAYSSPIVFFGKVIDRDGHPVANAKIHYSVADKYFRSDSKYEAMSDDSGLFSIRDVAGAGIWVNATKEGYEGTDHSGASFGYGVPTANSPPSQQSPAIFVLRKKGPGESLIKISSRQFAVPKSGDPVGVNLSKGKATRGSDAQIQVESWVNDGVRDERGRFDWRCRVIVPDGGLVERDKNNFEAPENGFGPSEEFSISKLQKDWSDRVEREYFLKLKDGTYARVKFQMMAGGHYNFFVLESYVNPSGSRNLEYDPAKEIKAH